MNKMPIYAVSLLLFAAFFACKQQAAHPDNDANDVETILLSNRQFAGENMALGHVQIRLFEQVVRRSASIVAGSNGMARINAPLSGLVQRISVQNGQTVRKHDVLLELSGPEWVELQRNYVEASAHLQRIQREYDRMRQLHAENVASDKEFALAQSTFKSAQAQAASYTLQLQQLGVSVERLEEGHLEASLKLRAPIDGVVSNLGIHLGQAVDLHSPMMDITDPAQLQLKISAFAEDLDQLALGQNVRVHSARLDTFLTATLHSIGNGIDPETKAITCFAHLASSTTNLLVHEYVEAEIVTGSEQLPALPSEAIVSSETGPFVLVVDQKTDAAYTFKKVHVHTGKQFNTYTEVQQFDSEAAVLVQGVYNIL